MSKTQIIFTAISLTFCLCALSGAAPAVIRYQGRLTDSAGQPITAPTEVTFSFYSAESGGSPLASFSDIDTVTPNADGIYTTLVGDPSPEVGIPAEVFAGDTVYLNVNVGGEDLLPRVLVTPSAYALEAVNAQTLGGHAAGEYRLGTATFTAAMDISAGDLVALNAQGQLQLAAAPFSTGGGGAGSVRNTFGVGVGPDKIVHITRTTYNGNQAQAMVCQLNGNSVSCGPEATFETEDHDWYFTAAALDDSHVIIVYTSSSSNSRAVVGTISGQELAFGASVEFSPAANTGPAVIAMDPTQVVIAYQDSEGGKAVVGSVSGNTVAFNSPVTFDPTGASPLSGCQVDSTRLLLVYGDAGQTTLSYIFATLDGGALSFGSPSAWDAWPNCVAVLGLDTDKVVLAYNLPGVGNTAMACATGGDSLRTFGGDAFDSQEVSLIGLARITSDTALILDCVAPNGPCNAVVGLLSPAAKGRFNLTCGTPFQVYDGPTSTISAAVFNTGQACIVTANPTGDGQDQMAFWAQLMDGPTYYVGVAEQTVARGEPCLVTIGGGITQQFSGLIAGRTYYVSSWGYPVWNVEAPAPVAGKALATNRFLVQY